MGIRSARPSRHLRGLLSIALIALAGGSTFAWLFYRADSAAERNALDVVKDFPIRDPRNEESGLCPWRQPEADRQRFFPEYPAASIVWRDSTLILTHDRPLLARLLGREPTAQENALQIHRLRAPSLIAPGSDSQTATQNLNQASNSKQAFKESGERTAGIVITRCIPGESGLIELVLALDVDAEGKASKVRGARLQRLREPDEVAQSLQSARFLGAFRGKDSRSLWELGKDIPEVPEAAKPSARAILEGTRAALILLSVGEQQLSRWNGGKSKKSSNKNRID